MRSKMTMSIEVVLKWVVGKFEPCAGFSGGVAWRDASAKRLQTSSSTALLRAFAFLRWNQANIMSNGVMSNGVLSNEAY